MIYAIIVLSSIIAVQGMAVCLLYRNTKKEIERADSAILNISVSANSEIEKLERQVADLQRGICPDYEAAKKAAESLDKFNGAVNMYLGYDMHDVIRAREGGGE